MEVTTIDESYDLDPENVISYPMESEWTRPRDIDYCPPCAGLDWRTPFDLRQSECYTIQVFIENTRVCRHVPHDRPHILIECGPQIRPE